MQNTEKSRRYNLLLSPTMKKRLEAVAAELTRREGYSVSQSQALQTALQRYHNDLFLDRRPGA